MSFKPADFFVSVLAFFAIILPGAVLAYLWRDAASNYIAHPGDGQGWVLFIVAAYLLGQALYALGSWFMDAVYDWTYKPYKKWKKKLEGDELLKPLIQQRMGYLEKHTGTYPWARAYVCGRSDLAATSIEKLDADSKFFRSLTVVAILAPFALAQRDFAWRAMIVSGVIAAIIAVLMYLYATQRKWQSLDQEAAAQKEARPALAEIVDSGPPQAAPKPKHPWLVVEALGGIPIGLVIVGLGTATAEIASRPSTHWWIVLGYLLAVAASFARFANQRWERDDTAYEFVLTLP